MQSLISCAYTRNARRFLSFLLCISFASSVWSNDTIPPTIVCPPNYKAILPVGACEDVVNYDIQAFDDNPGVMVTQTSGLPSGELFPIGFTTNTFIATDSSGNTSSCSFRVQLNNQDYLPCVDIIRIYLDSDCQGFLVVDSLLEAPWNIACHDSLVVDFRWGNGFFQPLRPLGQADIGKTSLFRVSDHVSHNSCWGTLRVYDTIPPAPVCSEIILPLNVSPAVVTPGYLVNTLDIPEGMVQFADNCGGPDTISYSDQVNVFSCTQPDNYTRLLNRTWQVTDINGNTATCLQHIYFQRDTNDVHFPADTTFSCTYTGLTGVAQTGYPFTEVNGVHFSLFPQLPSGFFITFQDTMLPFQCVGSRLLKRTWSVTDVCDNTPPYNPHLVHDQLITFIDDTRPVITAPEKIILYSLSGLCTDSINLPSILLEDACSPLEAVIASWYLPDSTLVEVDGIFSAGNNPGNVAFDTTAVFESVPDFPTGLTTVYWRTYDVCGNINIDSTLVELYDGGAPTITCVPALTVYLDSTGQVTIPATLLVSQWDDNCADTVAIRARKPGSTGPFTENIQFTCAEGGQTLAVTARVYDVTAAGSTLETFAPGQFTDCTTLITIGDTSIFQCNAPANVVIICSDYNPDLSTYGDFTFSCVTDSVSYSSQMNLFDPSCNSGIIIRKATAYRGNQTLTCEQQITINTAPNEYFIRFPRDTNLFVCNGNTDFGTPELLGTGCQTPTITYTDDVFYVVPDACYKIERVWTIQNHCTGNAPLTFVNNPYGLAGPVVAAPNTTGAWAPTFASDLPSLPPVNYSTFWKPEGGGYRYKQIIKYAVTTDPVVICPTVTQFVCDSSANDPVFWNLPFTVNPVGDVAEAPGEIRIYFKDQCLHPASFTTSGGFELTLDLDNDGYQETYVNNGPSANPGQIIYGNNSTVIQDQVIEFDNRPVPSAEKYKFAYEAVYLDTIAYLRLVWTNTANPGQKIVPQFPRGRHIIKWYVYDFCGNSSTCSYTFDVKECCLTPSITCTTDTIIYTLNNQTGIVPAIDMVTDIIDNGCNVTLGISDTPLLTGPYQQGLLIDCNKIGVYPLYLYGENQDGQIASCTAYIEVIDTTTNCDPVATAVGQLLTYSTNQGVANAQVRFNSSTAPGGNVQSAASGFFSWGSTGLYTGDYEVRPYKNDDPTNGLTAYDLIKISRHILNLEPLEFPFQMIAADANRSGTITTFDIVELRKLLLGTYDTLPNCPSWLFIPTNFVFNAASNNPFQPLFTEFLPVVPNGTYTFTGVKTGDLDYSVVPHFVSGETEDRNLPTQFLTTTDRWLEAGEIQEVVLTPKSGIVAIQGTLVAQQALITNVIPAKGKPEEDFALQSDQQHLAFVSFDDAQPFRISVQAQQAGYLSSMLHINGDITQPLAFDRNGAGEQLGLSFADRQTSAAITDIHLTASPNPVAATTRLSFFQQTAGNTSIEITDAQGRMLLSTNSYYSSGAQTILMNASLWPSGVYAIRVITPDGMEQVKVVRE